MTRFRAVIFISTITFSGCASEPAAHRDWPQAAQQTPQTKPETVVLLYGLGRTPLSMGALQQWLEHAGYSVTNWGYRSTRERIEEHGQRLHELLAELDADPLVGRIRLVGHCLGGIHPGPAGPLFIRSSVMQKDEKKDQDAREFAVVAMVRDFIFAAKIRSTAEAVGTAVLIVDSVPALRTALTANPIQLLIVDMSMTSHDSILSISVAKAHSPKPKILAFVAHVQQELMQMAKQGGADTVMPRSKFSVDLPALLGEYAQSDA